MCSINPKLGGVLGVQTIVHYPRLLDENVEALGLELQIPKLAWEFLNAMLLCSPVRTHLSHITTRPISRAPGTSIVYFPHFANL